MVRLCLSLKVYLKVRHFDPRVFKSGQVYYCTIPSKISVILAPIYTLSRTFAQRATILKIYPNLVFGFGTNYRLSIYVIYNYIYRASIALRLARLYYIYSYIYYIYCQSYAVLKVALIVLYLPSPEGDWMGL